MLAKELLLLEFSGPAADLASRMQSARRRAAWLRRSFSEFLYSCTSVSESSDLSQRMAPKAAIAGRTIGDAAGEAEFLQSSTSVSASRDLSRPDALRTVELGRSTGDAVGESGNRALKGERGSGDLDRNLSGRSTGEQDGEVWAHIACRGSGEAEGARDGLLLPSETGE